MVNNCKVIKLDVLHLSWNGKIHMDCSEKYSQFYESFTINVYYDSNNKRTINVCGCYSPSLPKEWMDGTTAMGAALEVGKVEQFDY